MYRRCSLQWLYPGCPPFLPMYRRDTPCRTLPTFPKAVLNPSARPSRIRTAVNSSGVPGMLDSGKAIHPPAVLEAPPDVGRRLFWVRMCATTCTVPQAISGATDASIPRRNRTPSHTPCVGTQNHRNVTIIYHNAIDFVQTIVLAPSLP